MTMNRATRYATTTVRKISADMVASARGEVDWERVTDQPRMGADRLTPKAIKTAGFVVKTSSPTKRLSRPGFQRLLVRCFIGPIVGYRNLWDSRHQCVHRILRNLNQSAVIRDYRIVVRLNHRELVACFQQ